MVPAERAAILPEIERQYRPPSCPLAFGDQRITVELGPAIAKLAVGRELVVLPMQAAETADADHAATAAPSQAHAVNHNGSAPDVR
jgi:hypothetical protein